MTITIRASCDSRAMSQASRLRPTMRTRKKATMLAMTTATRPPAEAVPTSYWISACRIDQEGDVGGCRPGPPPVVTKISANTVSRKIVSIRITTVIGRARCGSVI